MSGGGSRIHLAVGSIARMAVAAACVAVVVSTLAFVAAQSLPGDLAARVAEARLGDHVTFAAADVVREQTHLEDPVWLQYVRWIGSVATGQLGSSTVTGHPVVDEIARSLNPTAVIVVWAVVTTAALSTVVGVWSAKKPGGMIDRAFTVLAAMLSAFPSFLIGLVLVIVFAIRLRWLPAAGTHLSGYFVLPAATLALKEMPALSRVIRDAATETRNRFYIIYGQVKGQSVRRVVLAHALRPTLVPIAAFFGPMVANAIAGIAVIETLFNIDGLGSLLVNSVVNADIPVALGTALLVALVVVIVNGVTDLAVQLLDPRRESSAVGVP